MADFILYTHSFMTYNILYRPIFITDYIVKTLCDVTNYIIRTPGLMASFMADFIL